MVFSDQLQHAIRENESLVPFTWLRLGGAARYFAEPSTVEEFCGLIAAAHDAGLPVRILGSGSNILVRESGFDGLVVHLATAELCKVQPKGDRLIARAGAKLSHLVSAAVGAGLGGLERLAGIPGTVGAAIVSNAGTINDDIGSRVASVTIVEPDGKLKQLLASQLQFGYRQSSLEDSVIVEAEFKLRPGDPTELTRRMQSNWIVRRASQPAIGSRTVQAFIEPDEFRLGDILEAAGMRDASEGNFQLDSAHPGYVLTSGQPNSGDLLALISRVSRSVEAKSGIQLHSALKIW